MFSPRSMFYFSGLFSTLLVFGAAAFAADQPVSPPAATNAVSATSLSASSPPNGATPRKRIMLIGDSWAAAIATEQQDGPGHGTFDAVLRDMGYPTYRTDGYASAGGRSAKQFATDSLWQAYIARALSNPDLIAVQIIAGGIDFLNTVKETNVYQEPWNASVRDARWTQIQSYLQAIINQIRSARPDVKIVLFDYDYLGIQQANYAYGFTWGGMTQRQVNDAFLELAMKKKALADATPNCYYVSNWGYLQAMWNYPTWGLPTPGAYPTYSPFAGGNPDYGMPPYASVGDGIHPSDWGMYMMLERCVNMLYRDWLNDIDGDGVPYEEEIRDLNPFTPGTQTCFDPDSADATGNNFLNAPDGVLDTLNDYDGDGILNLEEAQLGMSPMVADMDNDGLKDGEELNTFHTDPYVADTDLDGYSDGYEVSLGADPLDPSTTMPAAAPWSHILLIGVLGCAALRRVARRA